MKKWRNFGVAGEGVDGYMDAGIEVGKQDTVGAV
jgi:hypothetical protein